MTDRAPILFTNHVMHGEYRSVISSEQGRIQDFKLGGGALNKIAPSGGRGENCWGISYEKSRF
jgi:hypothetical protein